MVNVVPAAAAPADGGHGARVRVQHARGRACHEVEEDDRAVLAAHGEVVAVAAERAAVGRAARHWLLEAVLRDRSRHTDAHRAAVQRVRQVMPRIEQREVHTESSTEFPLSRTDRPRFESDKQGKAQGFESDKQGKAQGFTSTYLYVGLKQVSGG